MSESFTDWMSRPVYDPPERPDPMERDDVDRPTWDDVPDHERPERIRRRP